MPGQPAPERSVDLVDADLLVRSFKLGNVGRLHVHGDHELGRYISSVTCAECHGPQLKGAEGDTPDLIVASGYTRKEFELLITQGVPTGGRKLKPLMQSVAKSRFSQLTSHERDALYAYLTRLAERPSE